MDSTYRLQHPTVDAVHAIIAIHESDNDNTCILYDFKVLEALMLVQYALKHLYEKNKTILSNVLKKQQLIGATQKYI